MNRVDVVPVVPETPALPPALARLTDLAYNLRWTWHHQAVDLFRRLDAAGWEATGHNPVRLLAAVAVERLEAAAAYPAYRADLDRAACDLDTHLAAADTWFARAYPDRRPDAPPTAYFSLEFGLAECLPIFSGGLGVLAGDHLKSASDLGVPLVGVGLLYREGYFRQAVDAAGRQRERYERADFAALPLRLERGPDGAPLTVEVALPGSPVVAQVWRAQVGRVALYLLDADLPVNRAAERAITARLYGGDQETRIRQEILLGLGGVRALAALGLGPGVCHMNEGHAAFLGLERARRLMLDRVLTFAEALDVTRPGLVFTTHTPVPAGHDYFPPALMARYFAAYAADLGVPLRDLLALGRKDPADDKEYFCMTTLALRLAGHSNGVSALHGEVSRQMWRDLWPDRAEADVPIGHVTNGVHLPTWVAPALADLYARHLGQGWRGDAAAWAHADRLPDADLWRHREQARAGMVAVARERLAAQLARRRARRAEVAAAAEVLDPRALTIGFARRFATYKRATLLLSDPARLARLLNDPARPVQVLFAGKAHPRDEGGKALIERIAALAARDEFRGKIVFLDDYDTALARELVRGVDLWLNTPERPHEASGTSGMKAAANGVLNLSTLDGWWAEAWAAAAGGAPIGWAIGDGTTDPDPARQAAHDAAALYDTLEREVIPTFYDRDAAGLPRAWLARVKASLAAVCPVYNTDRMVRQYVEKYEGRTTDGA
ncbi:MAG TPA: alpha-glucan family phosphorylase [Thermomicrobiales bacterium]|nr:alpha-glucan family phosphorylase [Thermomicrobiales bacterium]